MEKELRKIDNLNYVILRPAITYGLGDRVGLSKKAIGMQDFLMPELYYCIYEL